MLCVYVCVRERERETSVSFHERISHNINLPPCFETVDSFPVVLTSNISMTFRDKIFTKLWFFEMFWLHSLPLA